MLSALPETVSPFPRRGWLSDGLIFTSLLPLLAVFFVLERRPASRRARWFPTDAVARIVLTAAACLIFVLLAAIFFAMYNDSKLSMKEFGWQFLISDHWRPNEPENYGALSSINGTLLSTLIAMVIAVPVSILIALFLVELAPRWLSLPIGTAVELLAAVPSIIFGMWGLFVLRPIMADQVQPWIQQSWLANLRIGSYEPFAGNPTGLSLMTAGLVLAIMILPFLTAITRDVFQSVPRRMREAAFGLGGTTWEVTWKVTLPYGRRGIIGACLLGLGRAMGETMAVTYVIGDGLKPWPSLFEPARTISSTMANQFGEAPDNPLQFSALVELGFILLVMTVLVQILAQLWMAWGTARTGGAS